MFSSFKFSFQIFGVEGVDSPVPAADVWTDLGATDRGVTALTSTPSGAAKSTDLSLGLSAVAVDLVDLMGVIGASGLLFLLLKLSRSRREVDDVVVGGVRFLARSITMETFWERHVNIRMLAVDWLVGMVYSWIG